MRAILIALSLAGCSVDIASEDTSDIAQGLNGDTWSTVDNESNAAFDSVAISPTTRTLIVGGIGTSSNATEHFYTRRNPYPAVNTYDRHAFSFGAARSALATDSTGAFYLVATHDTNGQIDIYKSSDDGLTWANKYHTTNSPGGDVGITVDGSDRVFVTAGIVDSFGTNVSAVLRSTDHGATWQVAHEEAFSSVRMTGMCTGRFGQLQAVYAAAYTPISSPTNVVAFVSVDAGIHWQQLFTTHTVDDDSQPAGCAGHSGLDDVVFANTRYDGQFHWDSRDVKYTTGGVYPNTRAESVLTGDSAAFGALFVGGRRYVFGTSVSTGNVPNWRVRFSDDGSNWLDSENWHLTGNTLDPTIAHAAAYDTTRGLFIVGEATDSQGAVHGIVRHRD